MLNEISEYLASIDGQHARILRTMEAADPASLNWKPTREETNSLFVLGTHLIGSEHGLIFELLGNGPRTRNRPAEFLAQGTGLDNLRLEYQRVAEETRQILAPLTEEDLNSTRYREGTGQVTVRWIILHLIKHLSEHLGQMELTKQLWEQRG